MSTHFNPYMQTMLHLAITDRVSLPPDLAQAIEWCTKVIKIPEQPKGIISFEDRVEIASCVSRARKEKADIQYVLATEYERAGDTR